MLQKQGKLDEAVEVWKQVGKISPEYERLWLWLPSQILCLKLAKDADAVRYLESVQQKKESTLILLTPPSIGSAKSRAGKRSGISSTLLISEEVFNWI